MTHTSFRAAGFALALALAAGGCPHNADSPAPPVAVRFLSLAADGSETEPTTALTLTFSQAVPGLSAADITLEGGGTVVQKGALPKGAPRAGGVAYTLAVSGITKDGDVTVSVSKAGYSFGAGRMSLAPPPTDIAFESAAANGGETATTTALTLQFSWIIEGLTAEDITLESGGTGIQKGLLTANEADAAGVYTLSVSGIAASGVVTVRVAKAGYVFAPDARTVRVHWAPPAARFLSAAADGSETATTSALTLAFDQPIAGLAADDITLDDSADTTGIQKGLLSAPADGANGSIAYTLSVSGIAKSGVITVRVAARGYALAPNALSASVRWAPPVARFLSAAADGSEWEPTTALTLAFDQSIAGLAAGDITLDDSADTTGIRKGALSAPAAGADGSATYTLPVSGITKNGVVTVSAAKAGYAFSLNAQRVSVRTLPAAAFLSLAADGGAAATTTALTLTFDKAIPGLTAADIALIDSGGTGIQKGALSAPVAGANGSAVYQLSVSGIRKSGAVTARAAKAGYTVAPGERTVQVRWSPVLPVAVRFLSVMPDGSETAATSALTLTFDKAIAGLSADDITLDDPDYATSIRKGALSAPVIGADGSAAYRLPVSGIRRHGAAAVSVAKAGHTVAPGTRTAAVYGGVSETAFLSLAADGGSAATTAALTLTFGGDVSGLTAADIALIDTGDTGIQKGELSALGGGAYRLSVSGIAKSGAVTAKAAKAGRVFKPDTRETTAHWAPIAATLLSLTEHGSESGVTEALTLTFDKAIEGLSADDITLEDPAGTGIRKGALLANAAFGANGAVIYARGAYILMVSGIGAHGDVTARVAKREYAFARNALTARVYGPAVVTAFLSVTANGSESEDTTELTLAFDRDIPGLSAEHIALEDPDGCLIRKGGLTASGGGVYRLAVGRAVKNGRVTARVAARGYAFAPEERTALVHASGTVRFRAFATDVLAEDGMTELTLFFDKPVAGLTAADITLVNPHSSIHTPLKGAVRANGRTANDAFSYTLTVLGVFDGDFSATVAKTGYAFNPAERTAPVRTPISEMHYLSLTQDGTPETGTTRLLLTFDKPFPLDTIDVWQEGFENTSSPPFPYLNLDTGQETVRAGDTFTYEMQVFDEGPILQRDVVRMTLHSRLSTVPPETHWVEIYPIPPNPPPAAAVRFESLAADGGETANTATLTLRFSRDIAGLSAADIALADGYGTGIQKGALARTGSGTYALRVSGIRKGGFIEARVQKAGYRFEYVPNTGRIDSRMVWVYKAE
ncbi:hypothetical protein [Treponema endosymbiont of Eucomonympha sp.]|uniref:hypothetical protein n=1 Tax=Treponema endosymbiont of Eucomonympha sp. TaxID=1580831 RepID=UPI000750AFB8|nr:hypothetical protein [Treponema endosymbiont of Eucomonympha sp.]